MHAHTHARTHARTHTHTHTHTYTHTHTHTHTPHTRTNALIFPGRSPFQQWYLLWHWKDSQKSTPPVWALGGTLLWLHGWKCCRQWVSDAPVPGTPSVPQTSSGCHGAEQRLFKGHSWTKGCTGCLQVSYHFNPAMDFSSYIFTQSLNTQSYFHYF